MKNRFAEIYLSSIFTVFALFLAINSSLLMAVGVCDIDGNNRVEQNDIDLIFQSRNRPASTPFDPMDIDRNGVINTNDARQCVCALPTTADCDPLLNQIPVANPGPDQTLTQATFQSIVLNGGASSDADGDFLSFLWSFQQQPQNSQAVLLNANTVSPSFTPDRAGVYVLSLTVTDGFGDSSSNVVTINVDTPPSSLQAVADSNRIESGGVASGNIINNDTLGIGTTIINNISHNGQPITLGSLFTTAAGGSFLLQADGVYTYTSPSGLGGLIQEVFSYTINDETGASSSSLLTITVDPVIPPNNLPVAQNDSVDATAGGQAVTGNVLTNDQQGDQPTQVTPVSITATDIGGSFNLLADGSFTYTPPTILTTAVQEQFPYTITDSDAETSSAILTITVSPIISPNNVPAAQDDSVDATAGDQAVTGNVLTNDQQGDQPTQVTPVSITATDIGGSFNLLADGSFTYTPPTFLTTAAVQEQFPYTITDSDAETSSAILTITVSPQVIILNALPDINVASAAGAAIAGNVLDNDQLGNQPVNVIPINTTTANGGTFSLQNDGSYTYTPPSILTLAVNEVFNYTITNTNDETSSSTLTITVSPSEMIVANPDAAIVTAGGSAITGNLLGNDVLGNQSIQVTPVLTNSTTNLGGVFSLQADGSYSYTPPVSQTSVSEEIINYTITAGNGATSSSTLTITVNPNPSGVNLPFARPDENRVTAGGAAATGNVLTNDALGDQPTQLSGAVSNLQTPQGGIFTLAADGSYSYLPPAEIAGVVNESFEYTITDRDNDTSSSTLTITISPPPLAPLARPDENSVTAGGAAVTDNVLSNDDLGNEPTLVTPINVASTTNGGTFNLQEDGSYSYLPPATISGVITERFTYTITDSDSETSSSTLTITINPPPLTPLARPDMDSVTAGGAAAMSNVLSNDDLGNEPTLVASISITSTQNGGTFNLIADGSYNYMPPTTVSGVVTESFDYTITDSDSETSSSTLTITISPSPLTPLARPDVNSVTAGGDTVTGDVLINDDLGNEPTLVTAISITNTDNGGVFNLQAEGSYTYTPPATISGVVTEQFAYTIIDSDGETSSSTLTITINPASLTPLARPDVNSVTAGGDAVTGDVLSNDDLGNEPTQVTLNSTGAQIAGSLDLQDNGEYSYTPPTTVAGVITDQFTYAITDSNGETSSSTLTITVNPIPLTPFARPDELTVTAGSIAQAGDVSTNDDLGIQPSVITLDDSGNNITPSGVLNLQEDGTFTYTPPATGNGVITDRFTYTITDDNDETSSSTLTITVNPIIVVIEQPPIANPGSNQTQDTFDLITLDGSASSDPEGNPLTYLWAFQSQPPNSLAILLNETTVAPSFTPDIAGDYIVILTITDAQGLSDSATLTITVNQVIVNPPAPLPPTANPGPNQSQDTFDLIALNGSASSDPEGNPLTYLWSFQDQPANSQAALLNDASVSPSFTPDIAGDYIVILTVTDAQGLSDSATLTITVNQVIVNPPAPLPPTANPGPNQAQDTFDLIALDGSASSDPKGNPLTYLWSFQDQPANSQAVLLNDSSVSPSFTPDVAGDYVVLLTVTDIQGLSNSATVTITVRPIVIDPPPIADAGLDQPQAVNNQVVMLDGSGSSDPDGGMLTYAWSFESQPNGSQAILTGAETPLASFTPTVIGTYVVLLTVTDVQGISASDRVTIRGMDDPPP
ncbi:MAG: Ig-like domain-containing protein, partial [Granulosicoccaceae bacterium]